MKHFVMPKKSEAKARHWTDQDLVRCASCFGNLGQDQRCFMTFVTPARLSRTSNELVAPCRALHALSQLPRTEPYGCHTSAQVAVTDVACPVRSTLLSTA
jgi:hypothetical protein